MGKLEKLSNGRNVFHGFSTKNPEDMKQFTAIVKEKIIGKENKPLPQIAKATGIDVEVVEVAIDEDIPTKKSSKEKIEHWVFNNATKEMGIKEGLNKKDLLKMVKHILKNR